VSILALKVRRDIRRQKWQFIAVLVTVVLGVAMFAGSFNAYLNLGSSLEGSYDRLAMADMTVSGVSPDFSGTVEAIDGVDRAISRSQADLPFRIGDDSLLGRVSGVPAAGEPTINSLDIVEGTYLDPDDPQGVILESNAADDFDLGVGDTFLIADVEVNVVGIAISTEYLWPARDSQNAFTPPKSFAVAFVDQAAFDEDEAAQFVVTEQVLVLYDDGVDIDEVDAAVTSAAAGVGAASVQPLAEQPSNVVINTEIDGLQTIAIALPMLFLAAAGMAIYVVVTRLVFSQRAVIGTLRATGFSRRTMSRHYLSYGLGVGLIGAVIGAFLGALLGRGMTAIYTQVFGIPDLVAEFHLPTVLIALGFGAVAGVLAGVAPARTVARMAPAEAMRGEAPVQTGKQSIFERLIPPLRRAPVRWRMTLRGIGRNKKRSLSMVIGVILGMTLIMASWGMLDTMLLAFDRQFNDVAKEDATVVLTVPVDDAQLDTIASVDGVEVAEPVMGFDATIIHDGESFTTLLEGYRTDTEVHGFSPPLTDDGALLGHAMEDLLDVSVGDGITIRLAAPETEISTIVVGFVDEPLTTAAYMSIDTLTRLIIESDPSITEADLAAPSITSIKTLFTDGSDAETVVTDLKQVDTVAVVVDSNEVRDMVESFQALFYAFIGIMIVFGAAMAFALIFNIISVNVAERSSEFASMRANGLTHRRVASMIVGETGLLTAIGIIPGLIVGWLAAVAFMKSFSSPEFPITAELRPLTYIGSALAMFVVAALSLIPALRAVKRIDVGKIVRERSA
jgi:putative ABC transport system permease protein